MIINQLQMLDTGIIQLCFHIGHACDCLHQIRWLARFGRNVFRLLLLDDYYGLFFLFGWCGSCRRCLLLVVIVVVVRLGSVAIFGIGLLRRLAGGIFCILRWILFATAAATAGVHLAVAVAVLVHGLRWRLLLFLR